MPGAAAPALVPTSVLPAAPLEPRPRGVYVHVPFCIVRCGYCDFNAYSSMEEVRGPYVEALLREIAAAADGGRVDTIFVGGGTPTELAPALLGRILAGLRGAFAVAPGAEITVEANPESVDASVFDTLLAAGVNRVSIGVQSLTPPVLAALGRVHSADRALEALRAALTAGFRHVNADLIFGTPGEGVEDWQRSLDGVLETGVDHLSAYALTVEEGTPLRSWVDSGRMRPPDEDDQADKYELAEDLLDASGLVRYEISNWSRPGSWCRHNVGYWAGADYLGFGAGAHSHRNGRRWWNLRSPRSYAARSPSVEEGSEQLDPGKRAEDAAVLGLRLAGGLDRAVFARAYGCDPLDRWGGALTELTAEGLLEITPTRVRLAPRGFLLAGRVARALIDG
ncbi:MAG: radical SAM family heme chaperone HemW [Actinomycetota bacterium]